MAKFNVLTKMRSSMHILRRYGIEHLMNPIEFFYIAIVRDFYATLERIDIVLFY